MKQVAIYSRVSTSDQDNENQLKQLRAYCQSQGYQVVHEYVDTRSGGTDDRPQFKLMFLHASQRKFDHLLFWALDRLSREGASKTLKYLEQLTEYGITFRSFTEPYLDSLGMFRDAVIAILAVIAKQERSRLSERVVAGLEKARAKGKVLGRRPTLQPYQILEAKKLKAERRTLAQIAKELKCSVPTVMKALRG